MSGKSGDETRIRDFCVPRTANALGRAGVHTLEALLSMSVEQLTDIEGVGHMAFAEVCAKIKRRRAKERKRKRT